MLLPLFFTVFLSLFFCTQQSGQGFPHVDSFCGYLHFLHIYFFFLYIFTFLLFGYFHSFPPIHFFYTFLSTVFYPLVHRFIFSFFPCFISVCAPLFSWLSTFPPTLLIILLIIFLFNLNPRNDPHALFLKKSFRFLPKKVAERY